MLCLLVMSMCVCGSQGIVLRLWFAAEKYHKCSYHGGSLLMEEDYNNNRLFCDNSAV